MTANFTTILARRIAALAAGFIVSLSLTSASVANAATYNVTAEAGGFSGMGTFTIADSLLTADTLITFDQFTDFSFLIDNKTFVLADNIDVLSAADPVTEGVLTDATGTVTQFSDSNGGWVQFVLFPFAALRFEDATSRSFIYEPSYDVTTHVTGTYEISPVPLPPALLLLGVALAGMAGFNRLKRQSVTGQGRV